MPEVVVVGGGVMGLATAWRLREAGTDVQLIERFAPGHGNGSSHGATRVFRYLYHDPLYVHMAQAALPMWRELEAATGRDLLHMTGGVQVDSASIIDVYRRAMTSCGATVEILSPEDRRERFGWIDCG